MGAVAGAIGGIGGAIGGVTDLVGGIMGGGQKTSSNQQGGFSNEQTSSRTLGPQTDYDRFVEQLSRQQLGGLGQQLGQQQGQASADYQAIASQFRDALTRFATGTSQPSPEQLAQATSFVDQTFTAPAQQQYGQFLQQAQDASSRKAAALGRSSLDSAIQGQFAGQASDVANQLANQRGSLIAQRADELAFGRPQQQLAALGQGSAFFNQPLQNAMSNQLALLNAATAQQNLGLNRQLQTGTSTTRQSGSSFGSGSQTTPGASLGSLIGNAAAGLGGLSPIVSNLFGGSGGGSNQSYGTSLSPGQLNTSYTPGISGYFGGY